MHYRTIISTGEAASLLGAPDVVVLDCRASLADPDAGYRAWKDGHLAGACFLDLEKDLSGPKTGQNGRHPLPDWAQLSKTLARCGVNDSSQVIVYDDNMTFAPRLWWMLRYLGHEAVAVLDGGLAKWQREGRPLSQDAPDPVPGNFQPHFRHPEWLARAADVEALPAAAMCILDARAPDRYAGENETLDPVGGHIPGARNHFFMTNYTPEGTFKSPEILRSQLLAALDNDTARIPVHQCGSGVTACANFLAMEIAGLPPGRLYAGSWSEWCSDPRRPVATGPRP